MSKYAYLRPYSTPRQLEFLDILADCNDNISAAAKKIGIGERNSRALMKRLRKSAAIQGVSPENDMNNSVPDGFVVSGVSTYYNEEGQPTAQWVKSKLAENQKLQMLQDAIADAVEEHRGKAKPVKQLKTKEKEEDVALIIPMGDPHIGMYAWAEESGEDFDINIAHDDLLKAAEKLVNMAPTASRCVIINLGDFFHSDNKGNTTTRGTSVDVDTRWSKVLKLGCMIMVDIIRLALKKHPHVEVINAIGNHDDHSSIMLAAFLDAYFSNEDRVTIQPTTSKFHYFKFGKCLLGVTHGDTIKHNDLGEVMATDKPEDWGSSEHRYWYVGHIHHSRKTELRGCTVESFRTLAAKDAWHAAKGYRSGRDMNAIVFHKEFGEIARYRCDIRMARYG